MMTDKKVSDQDLTDQLRTVTYRLAGEKRRRNAISVDPKSAAQKILLPGRGVDSALIQLLHVGEYDMFAAALNARKKGIKRVRSPAVPDVTLLFFEGIMYAWNGCPSKANQYYQRAMSSNESAYYELCDMVRYAGLERLLSNLPALKEQE